MPFSLSTIGFNIFLDGALGLFVVRMMGDRDNLKIELVECEIQ